MLTLRLNGNNPSDVAWAGDILRLGGVVAIPTETVYGLAANALMPEAVADVFAAKGRPADNPLIVHIADMDQLGLVCREITQSARLLADAFWPGPLTLVLPRTAAVPDITTGGLDTVGVRMPSHRVARAVIRAATVPLAAPSANLSGRPSATSAAHVLSDFEGAIDAVVDGGICDVGVESTVVDVTGPVPRVLRPGAVTAEMIAAVAGAVSVADGHVPEGQAPPSPGMKYRHYAPRAEVRLFTGAPADTFAALLAQAGGGGAAICFEEYAADAGQHFAPVYSFGSSWDHAAHARRLYDLLRQADRDGVQRLSIQCPRPYGAGRATFNRLERCAQGQITPCTDKIVIGVTGRSGSGKSVFGAHLAQRGALCIDADAVYGQLLRSDTAMQGEILARFPQARADQGGIDRRALGRAVFSDRAALLDLNAITHPHVNRAVEARLAQAAEAVVVLDVPILFGSGADRLCSVTVGLLSDEAAALRRIMARDGIDEAAARLRLSAQQGDDFFRRRCDVIVENRGDRARFVRQIDALMDSLEAGV